MRTRRRREPVFWLPTIGKNPSTGTKPVTDYNSTSVTVSATADDITTIIRQPFDTEPLETAGAPGFPGDIIYATAQEYFLKRIVGKIWCDYTGESPGSAPRFILASAGLFVSKTGAGGGVVPTTYDASIDYGVSAGTTVREPWIWRRSWILEHDTSLTVGVQARYPRSNAGYGSVLDGPHVDAKTKRRVSNDDDIHIALSASALEGGTMTGIVNFYWELRGLASTRKPRNRGVF